MFVPSTYEWAVALCVLTMLCWGSWANTQKLAGKTWRFELYYWDYVIGMLLTMLAIAFTLGSNGGPGRSFMVDIYQAQPQSLMYAFFGGAVFNLANILLVAAIAVAGLSVAFPIGIGLALALGVIINYTLDNSGNANLLFGGVGLVVLAIIIDALAYKRLPAASAADSDSEKSGAVTANKGIAKGLILAVVAGTLMSLFYYLVANSLAGVMVEGNGPLPINAGNMLAGTLTAGQLTPYTALVVFGIGVLVSNFIINPIIMYKPVEGAPVSFGQYFTGSALDHLWGIIGGMIWAIGMSANVIASGTASPAVSYGLGQGATMIAAFWGVFLFREFKNAKKGTGPMLGLMFLLFLVGLAMIVYAKM